MKSAVFLVVLLYIFPALVTSQATNSLNVLYEWKLLDFAFPTAADRTAAINNKNFIPANNVLIDVQPCYTTQGFKLFATVPRFQGGVPFSLAQVNPDTKQLQPYPNYSWHSSHGANCDGITSAFRVALDNCNQMWVIDSGRIGNVQYCRPQLLLFNILTNTLVHRFRFDDSLFIPSASLFVTAVINVKSTQNQCKSTTVYVADTEFHGLVVYDYEKNLAWRVQNKFMYPDPYAGTFTISGQSFTLMDGILGMATEGTNLIFHPLASVGEYYVPLSVLDKRTDWLANMEAYVNEFKELGTRTSQCAAEAGDSRGNLYCVTMNPVQLLKWNINTAYTARNLQVVSNVAQLMEFVSGMKIVFNFSGREELWMASNRFQKIATGTQNANEINFRIIGRYLDDL